MSKRNHHLQPNFYLKGFSSDPNDKNPKIWIYEKNKRFYEGKNEKLQNPKHRTTEKAAYQKDYYAFEIENGAKNYEKYENILRDEFEEPAKPIIEKIRKFENIDKSDERLLFRYVASMVTRGEWWKYISEKIDEIVEPETQARIETFSLEIAKIARDAGNEWFSDVSNLREFFQKSVSKDIKKRKRGEYEKDLMIRYAEKFSDDLLSDLNVQFLIAPDYLPFLTSDNPVCYSSFKQKEVSLYFPISSRICLYATRINKSGFRGWKINDKGFWQIDDKTVEKIREFLVSKAIREVYYSKKAQWLVEFINRRPFT